MTVVMEREFVTSTTVAMGTVVTIDVIASSSHDVIGSALDRAFGWFTIVERQCSRFDPRSDVQRLAAQPGRFVTVGVALFEAARFAVELAIATDGAFDPTIGRAMERRGFDRAYVTGEQVVGLVGEAGTGTYRDIDFDIERRAIRLRCPVLLDLGAVAKGLAIDLAARELADFDGICIDAGGDIFGRGLNGNGEPWKIGIQDPHAHDEIARELTLSDAAACTSGGYERSTSDGIENHLLNPLSGRSPRGVASATVIAPTAMAADGCATACVVLGMARGRRFLEDAGLDGLLIADDGAVVTTRGFRSAAS